MNDAETRATDIESTQYERTLAALKTLKKSLLHQAFIARP